MPSSSVRTFTDSDEYAAAIRQGTHELTLTRRGTFAAKLARIDLHRLWMQRFSEELPRTSHVEGWGGRAIITFRTQPGAGLIRNGVELEIGTISRLPPGASYYQHSSGAVSYGAMSLPLEDMAKFGAAIAGCNLSTLPDALTINPPAARMTRLQNLHAAAAQLAEHAPAVIAHPEAANGLEQALIEAMVYCLGSGDGGEDRSTVRQHALIMRKFHRSIAENSDNALFIPELCAAIGVSERTLRACCQEQLGISPKRYLLLRRMHLVRRALRDSAASATTVTEIATRYGFWQFGRLAGEYKALFGELPGTTLARAPE